MNESLYVIKNRGGKRTVIDLRKLRSQKELIELKVAFEKWTFTDFWKRWVSVFVSIPIITLVTLTTNELIKLRKDVLKGYRWANDVSELTDDPTIR